jgi:hypothetical protein
MQIPICDNIMPKIGGHMWKFSGPIRKAVTSKANETELAEVFTEGNG